MCILEAARCDDVALESRRGLDRAVVTAGKQSEHQLLTRGDRLTSLIRRRGGCRAGTVLGGSVVLQVRVQEPLCGGVPTWVGLKVVFVIAILVSKPNEATADTYGNNKVVRQMPMRRMLEAADALTKRRIGNLSSCALAPSFAKNAGGAGAELPMTVTVIDVGAGRFFPTSDAALNDTVKR